MKRLRVAVFGSTGSVGRATLEVISHLGNRFQVSTLAARSSVRAIALQARRFKPERVILTELPACKKTREMLGSGYEVDWGLDPLIEVATSTRTDILVMAMSGTMGILPVSAALEMGKRVCLATKEILVSFGDEVMRLARKHGGELLPIDSELAGLHQCLADVPTSQIRKVIITASGGPFWRSGPPPKATVNQTLAHPTWRMGRKITVDSATLMNKGLEVIETTRLFGLEPCQVQAVIHPQSVVHAAVEFQDGSMLAQLANPDMRLPIQYCLTYPQRLDSLVRPLRLESVGRLEFHPINQSEFPCFRLARRALEQGPTATCVLNAANQVAVEAFLAGGIAFGEIPHIISRTLKALQTGSNKPGRRRSIRSLLRSELHASAHAESLVQRKASDKEYPD